MSASGASSSKIEVDSRGGDGTHKNICANLGPCARAASPASRTHFALAEKAPAEGAAILDANTIEQRKELRKQRQEQAVHLQLRRQGIDVGGGRGGDVEDFYDTTTEVKKEDGVTIEPFRMEGFFNRDGAYVERSNQNDDPWYREWEERQKLQQKQQQERQDGRTSTLSMATGSATVETASAAAAPRPSVEGDGGSDQPVKSDIDLQRELMGLLEPGETVIRAIRRLGKRPRGNKRPAPVQHWRKSKKRKTGEADAKQTPASRPKKSAEEQKRAQDLDKISGLANELMSRGRHDVYQASREGLQGEVRAADAKKQQAKEWEYKFSKDGPVHSGFTASQMQKWKDANYFKVALVRKTGSDSPWLPCDDSFQFD